MMENAPGGAMKENAPGGAMKQTNIMALPGAGSGG